VNLLWTPHKLASLGALRAQLPTEARLRTNKQHSPSECTGVPRSLCLETYGGPRGLGVSYERGSPVYPGRPSARAPLVRTQMLTPLITELAAKDQLEGVNDF